MTLPHCDADLRGENRRFPNSSILNKLLAMSYDDVRLKRATRPPLAIFRPTARRTAVRYWILAMLFVATTLDHADRATLSITSARVFVGANTLVTVFSCLVIVKGIGHVELRHRDA